MSVQKAVMRLLRSAEITADSSAVERSYLASLPDPYDACGDGGFGAWGNRAPFIRIGQEFITVAQAPRACSGLRLVS